MSPGTHSMGDRPASGCSDYGRAWLESHRSGTELPPGGSNEEGHQVLRFIDMPGVEVKRCRLGQQMGQRGSNLQGCSRAHIVQ
jgi:hypothetical protein